jgi:hypothetical protein
MRIYRRSEFWLSWERFQYKHINCSDLTDLKNRRSITFSGTISSHGSNTFKTHVHVQLSVLFPQRRNNSPYPRSHLSPTRNMSHQSRSSPFPGIFESALQDYAKTTNITLATHELTKQLRDCHSVESVTVFLQDQARELGYFRGSDRVMRSIENMVSVLYVLSDTATFGDAVLPVHSVRSRTLVGCVYF